tara:strand:+ start:415 stop:687 length:273 start_codon:yes stop_codon:yes gene_type:complete
VGDVEVKADTYFASLETEIRESLKDEELRRDLVRQMATKLLTRHGKVRALQHSAGFVSKGNPEHCYVEFSDALIDGVAAIIMDELRKGAK